MRVAVFLLICAIPALAEWVILEQIIAKVNDEIITRAEYEDAAEKARTSSSNPRGDEANAAGDRDALRNLIDERLLIQRGNNLNVNVEAQVLRQRDEIMRRYELQTVEEFENFAIERAGLPVEDFMDQIRRNVLAQAVIGQEVAAKIIVPRDDIAKYYEEHKTEFIRSEGVRLRQILVSTDAVTREKGPDLKQKANDLLERVKKGEPFAEMAQRFSADQASAGNGGDIGVFRRGQLKAEIENEVFSHGRGYITDLIEVPNGYLILKIEERYTEGLAELDEVQEEIRSKLAEPRWEPTLRAYLSDLRRDAYIEIRPGYVDTGAVAEMDTSWNDPAKLEPVTTTKEKVLQTKKRRRILGIPLPTLPGGRERTEPEEPGGHP